MRLCLLKRRVMVFLKLLNNNAPTSVAILTNTALQERQGACALTSQVTAPRTIP